MLRYRRARRTRRSRGRRVQRHAAGPTAIRSCPGIPGEANRSDPQSRVSSRSQGAPSRRAPESQRRRSGALGRRSPVRDARPDPRRSRGLRESFMRVDSLENAGADQVGWHRPRDRAQAPTEVTSVLPELWDSESGVGDDVHEVRLQPEGCRRAEVQGHDAHDERAAGGSASAAHRRTPAHRLPGRPAGAPAPGVKPQLKGTMLGVAPPSPGGFAPPGPGCRSHHRRPRRFPARRHPPVRPGTRTSTRSAERWSQIPRRWLAISLPRQPTVPPAQRPASARPLPVSVRHRWSTAGGPPPPIGAPPMGGPGGPGFGQHPGGPHAGGPPAGGPQAGGPGGFGPPPGGPHAGGFGPPPGGPQAGGPGGFGPPQVVHMQVVHRPAASVRHQVVHRQVVRTQAVHMPAVHMARLAPTVLHRRAPQAFSRAVTQRSAPGGGSRSRDRSRSLRSSAALPREPTAPSATCETRS